MTIYVGSRYEDDPVDRVKVVDGTYVPTIYHQDVPRVQVFNFAIRVTEYGDRMDTLAAEFLGDAELGWVIANANPELLYPDDIPVGTVLRIPDARVVG